jgi:hypothetical protein
MSATCPGTESSAAELDLARPFVIAADACSAGVGRHGCGSKAKSREVVMPA